MNQISKFYEGREIRIFEIDGEPWFVAKDVCGVLEIQNVTQALQRLDEDERSMLNIGRQGETNIVNEPGLYTLILGSRKPEAKQFKRWITHEVIPSIRAHGAYMTPEKIEEVLMNPDTIIDLAMRLKEEQEKRRLAEKQIEEQRPKVESFEMFMAGDGTQSMNEAAKSLGIGRNKLFRFLREIGVLMENNLPYQRYQDAGYFKVVEVPRQIGQVVRVFPTPRVTPKGIAFIGEKLREHNQAS